MYQFQEGSHSVVTYNQKTYYRDTWINNKRR